MNARDIAARVPGSQVVTQWMAERIMSKPSMQLFYEDPLMAITIHLCSEERYVFVRSVMPLHTESVNGLVDKESARVWVNNLIKAGFQRVSTQK